VDSQMSRDSLAPEGGTLRSRVTRTGVPMHTRLTDSSRHLLRHIKISNIGTVPGHAYGESTQGRAAEACWRRNGCLDPKARVETGSAMEAAVQKPKEESVDRRTALTGSPRSLSSCSLRCTFMGYLERLSGPLSCFIIHIRPRTCSSHSASQGSPEWGLQPPQDQGYLFPLFF
jgi:hypothetical protein